MSKICFHNASLDTDFSSEEGVPVEHSLPVGMLENQNWFLLYQEILSTRREHSHLLDEAYTRAYYNKTCHHENTRHKKLVNFLAISQDEFLLLSRDKCLKRLKECKEIIRRMTRPVDQQSQPLTSTNREEPYWRDEIFDKIRSYRQDYSYQLDEAFQKVDTRGLQEEYDACHSFLGESLQFLAKCRADIALLDSKDDCNKQLGDIARFASKDESFGPAHKYEELLRCTTTGQQSSDHTRVNNNLLTKKNWRDVAYDQLQHKADRFSYQVYVVYLGYKKAVSESNQTCDLENLKDLEGHLSRALNLYEMSRARMSFFTSMDDYFELVDWVTRDILSIIEFLRIGEEHKEGVIPKQDKLLRLLQQEAGRVVVASPI